MSEPSWGKYGSWDEAESYVGKIIGQDVAADAVELGSIRRWLEPKEFDCALHTDAEVAKSAGYADVIAPDTMVFSYGLPPYWSAEDGNAKSCLNYKVAESWLEDAGTRLDAIHTTNKKHLARMKGGGS